MRGDDYQYNFHIRHRGIFVRDMDTKFVWGNIDEKSRLFLDNMLDPSDKPIYVDVDRDKEAIVATDKQLIFIDRKKGVFRFELDQIENLQIAWVGRWWSAKESFGFTYDGEPVNVPPVGEVFALWEHFPTIAKHVFVQETDKDEPETVTKEFDFACPVWTHTELVKLGRTDLVTMKLPEEFSGKVPIAYSKVSIPIVVKRERPIAKTYFQNIICPRCEKRRIAKIEQDKRGRTKKVLIGSGSEDVTVVGYDWLEDAGWTMADNAYRGSKIQYFTHAPWVW